MDKKKISGYKKNVKYNTLFILKNRKSKTVTMLSEANAEVDRLREELTPKVNMIFLFFSLTI